MYYCVRIRQMATNTANRKKWIEILSERDWNWFNSETQKTDSEIRNSMIQRFTCIMIVTTGHKKNTKKKSEIATGLLMWPPQYMVAVTCWPWRSSQTTLSRRVIYIHPFNVPYWGSTGVTHQPKQNKTLGTKSPFIVQIRFASRCSSQNVSHLMAPESKKIAHQNWEKMLPICSMYKIFSYIWLKFSW